MRAKLFFLFLFLCTTIVHAKEGMWLPFLLEKMNEKEMTSMGMKIKAKDIYDVNQGSLKDAVVIFGGGCTGEVVSDKGLVLTNHHCGYGSVQGLSSITNNYLTQGFFAKNQESEIPCPGLSVTFIIRIDEVTKEVTNGIIESMHDTTKSKLLKNNIDELEKKTKTKTGYDALVKSFYYDNQYYMILSEKYTDIRLVGFPPNGIGKFGGDTDNWAWPRHTGDFGLFRIYANAENKPAEYNASNKPFKPRRSLKINIGGLKQDDFTMVYGFPGRTQEYLTSDGVQEVMELLDPIRIKLREKRLSIMEEDMKQSEETFIQYASKQARIANYYKKWKGELLGLQINDAINKKKKEEKQLQFWINSDAIRRMKYGNILDSIATCYADNKQTIKLSEYILESIWASELLQKGSIFIGFIRSLDTMKNLDSLVIYQREMDAFHKSINIETDYKITKELFAMYKNEIGDEQFTSAENVDAMYTQSVLCDPKLFSDFIHLKDLESIKKILVRDPIFVTYSFFDAMQKANNGVLRGKLQRLNKFYTKYMQALQEKNRDKMMYPDANSTMRVSYGKIEGVNSTSGVKYNYYTTLDGAVLKHNPKSEEFNMPNKLLKLYKAKDYGRYAIKDKGKTTVPIAFLASNHTTGGNSGSPVLNSKGELIGTNFDRIWEGTMSDILFDPNLCRNITLDVRYTLFIIEKFGGAKWVVDEMNVVSAR